MVLFDLWIGWWVTTVLSMECARACVRERGQDREWRQRRDDDKGGGQRG